MRVNVVGHREELQAVLRSQTFANSDSLRRLLNYLGEMSITGEADSLKEYTIGVDAFGKSAAYDPRRDSIVRLQAGRLRQKLAEYYQAEGSQDQIRLDLPKGAFRIVFSPWAAEKPAHTWTVRRELTYALLAGALFCAIWAGWATYRLAQLPSADGPIAWSPSLNEFWKPFLDSKRATLVAIGNPLFVRVQGGVVHRNAKLNDWAQLPDEIALLDNLKKPEFSALSPWFGFTGVGEANAAFLLARHLGTRRQDLSLTRSNTLSWEQVATHNMIFLGPPKFNLQVAQMPIKPEFVIEPHGIRNLRPASGEAAFYSDQFVPGRTQDGVTHALISRFPGLNGNGEVLVLAGNAGADTLAATQWVTQPKQTMELAQHLSPPLGHLPPYFQAVIKTEFKNHVPIFSAYVCHHVLRIAAP